MSLLKKIFVSLNLNVYREQLSENEGNFNSNFRYTYLAI